MRVKKNKEKKNMIDDPVRNFEKWKKKYDKTKTRIKRVQKPTRKKRDWEVERENIQRLVNKYSTVRYMMLIFTSISDVYCLFLGVATCLLTCYAAVVTSSLTDRSFTV